VKFGLFCHLFIGSIMLSNNNFFPANEELDTGVEVDTSVFNDLDNPGATNFIAAYFVRLQSGSQGAIYLSFIVILFILWISSFILNILFNFLGFLLKPL
jgi:hypothetical protein